MKKVLISGIVVAILMASCQSNDNDPTPKPRKDIPLTRTEQEMAILGNEFAFNFFKQVNTTERKDNFFISPLSASFALSMTTNGAAGETLEEMKSTLGFRNYSLDEMNDYYQKLINGLLEVDNTTELGIANSIWIRDAFTVENPFINVNKEKYNAEVRSLDFSSPSAVDIINQWCSNKTNKRIPTIIKEINEDSQLFLINALYFKGIWKNKFDAKNTNKEDFTNITGTKTKVDMMRQECAVQYTAESGFQIAELPYGNEAFSMVVILPDEDKSIQEIITDLTADNWEEWLDNTAERKVDIKLPRFKLDYERELNEDLKAMGMPLAFSQVADFSKISTTDLFIGLVKQKTFVEVNEKGTEAAAVTVVEGLATDAGPANLKTFHVNRPFIYLIKEKSTGSILFMGKMGSM